VRERVEPKQDDSREFLFVGANQEAALTAAGMGTDADQSLDTPHTDEGVRAAYESTADQISQARQAGSTDGYDEADRPTRSEDGRRPERVGGGTDGTGCRGSRQHGS